MPPNARAAPSANAVVAVKPMGFSIPCPNFVHDMTCQPSAINLADFPQHAEDNAPSLANPTKQVTTITLEMENKASGDAKE